MAYEKPELVALSIAASAVRGLRDGDGSGIHLKATAHPEGSVVDTGLDGADAHTSTTTAAYEADE